MKKSPVNRQKKPRASSTTEVSIEPRPAFWPFMMEQEPEGESRMRRLVRCMHDSVNAPNVSSELDTLYMDALGKPPKWKNYFNVAGETVFRETHDAVGQKAAAEDLVKLTLVAVKYVEMLSQPSHRNIEKAGTFRVALPHGRDEMSQTERSNGFKAQSPAADMQSHSGVPRVQAGPGNGSG
jgi:hypothetical protein